MSNHPLLHHYLTGLKSLLQTTFDSIDATYVKRSRILNSKYLFSVLVELLNKKSSYAQAIAQLAVKKEYTPVSKSSLHKFREKIPWTELKQLCDKHTKLLKQLNLTDSQYKIYNIDTTKVIVNKSLIQHGFIHHSTNKCLGQATISCCYESATGIPADLIFSSNRNERFLLYKHLNELEANSIVVTDRGYQGFQVFNYINQCGKKYICRLKTEANCRAVQLAMRNKMTDQIIVFKPIKDKNSVPIKLRIIKYIINNKNYFIGTNLFNTEEFPALKLQAIYAMRWNIEEQIKFIKEVTSVGSFHSHSENGIKQEIYVAMFLCGITKTIEFLNNYLLSMKQTQHSKKFNSIVLCNTVKIQILEIMVPSSDILAISLSLTQLLQYNMISNIANRAFPRKIIHPTTKEKYNNYNKKKP